MLTLSVYFSRSASTLSEISFTFICILRSSSCFFMSVFIEEASSLRLGSTSLAMRP